MRNMGPDDDFYEEDEDVNDLLAAFDRAEEKGKTARPISGKTEYFDLGLITRIRRMSIVKSRNAASISAA